MPVTASSARFLPASRLPRQVQQIGAGAMRQVIQTLHLLGEALFPCR